jgi:hypothetical protein
MHLMSRCQTILVCPLLALNTTFVTFSFCGSDVFFSPVLTQITFSRWISLCGFPFTEPFPFVFFLPHCHSVMLQTYSSRFSSTRITKDKIPFYVLLFFFQHPLLKTSPFRSQYVYPFDHSAQNIFLISALGALEWTDIVSA